MNRGKYLKALGTDPRIRFISEIRISNVPIQARMKKAVGQEKKGLPVHLYSFQKPEGLKPKICCAFAHVSLRSRLKALGWVVP